MFTVIPALNLTAGRLKSRSTHAISTPNPLALSLRWVASGATRLHVIDLDTANGHNSTAPALLVGLKAMGIAIQVGGGIRDARVARSRIMAGASDIVVGGLVNAPGKLTEMVSAIGAPRLIVNVAVYDGQLYIPGQPDTHHEHTLQALHHAHELGIRRCIVTATHELWADSPPNTDTLALLADSGWTVWASGGIRQLDHLKILSGSGADGAIVGQALLEGQFSWAEAQAFVAAC